MFKLRSDIRDDGDYVNMFFWDTHIKQYVTVCYITTFHKKLGLADFIECFTVENNILWHPSRFRTKV